MTKLRTVLVIIDPQNCFMDLPDAPLPVKGAVSDIKRLIRFIQFYASIIDEIIISLDTQPFDHIGHANRWVDADGNHPAPYTAITYEDCLEGKWRAANAVDQIWQLEYLKRLTRTHYIWPVHGQKPEWEWQMLIDLLVELSKHNCDTVRTVEKGMHRDVEQFGMFGAEVPFPGAPETDINHALITEIDSYDRVIFAGEASSHCVMDSVNQFLLHMPSGRLDKVVLLKDCMSPVNSFEQSAADWLADMSRQGLQVIDAMDFEP